MELIQLMAKFATNKVAPIDLIFILWCFRWGLNLHFPFHQTCWQPRVHLAAHSPKEPSHSIFTIPRNSFGRTFHFFYFYFLLFTFPHLLPFSSEVLASESSFGSSKERATTFPTGPLSPPFFFDLSSEFIWQDGCDGCGRDSIFTSQGLFFCPLSHLQSYGEQSALRTKFYYFLQELFIVIIGVSLREH